jgi:hypothetical protein
MWLWCAPGALPAVPRGGRQMNKANRVLLKMKIIAKSLSGLWEKNWQTAMIKKKKRVIRKGAFFFFLNRAVLALDINPMSRNRNTSKVALPAIQTAA